MKYSFISLIVGIILIVGAFLILQRGNVSPFKVSQLQELINENQIGENDYELFEEKIDELIANGQIEVYLESSSVVIFVCTLALGVALVFFGIHSIVDKLFFKKFFEKANFPVAIRRALLFTGVIVAGLILRFYRVEWNMVVLLIPLFIVIELIVVYFSADKSEERPQELPKFTEKPVFVNTTAEDGHISGREFENIRNSYEEEFEEEDQNVIKETSEE